MGWMGWKRGEESGRTRAQRRTGSEPMGGGEIRSALERRGVDEEWSRILAERLEPAVLGRDRESATALLDGVGIAFCVQQEASRELATSLRGLKEMERIMGAFSGELSKLDEVLEVLAAYVRRMRSSGATESPSRTLH